MARRQSISWAELRVGLLVIASFGLLAATILFVGGDIGFFAPRYTVTAYFRSAGGMNTGAEVWLEGVTIGNVQSIQVTNDPDPDRFVAITMSIDERFDIPSDAVLTIGTIGLLGDSIVEITRGDAVGAPLVDGGEIQGESGGDIREIIQSTSDVVANLEVLSDQVNQIAARIDQGEGTLGRILTDESIFDNLNSMTAEANLLVREARSGEGTIGRFISDPSMYERATDAVTRMENIVAGIENGEGTLGLFLRDRSIYDRADQILTTAEGIVDRVERGDGTIGRLLTDESLFDNFNEAAEGISVAVNTVTNSEGTAGKLINDPSLYDNVNQTVSEMLKLMYDFRQDPGKFLTINFRLF